MQTLVLGTANFGDNYGLGNKSNLSKSEVDKILVWSKSKISELDTSCDYKGSHSAISRHGIYFKITTKINLDLINNPSEIRTIIRKISEELQKDYIERILLRPHSKHSTFTLEAIEELEKLKSKGAIVDLGLSIYETRELEYFSSSVKEPITFQVPLNLFNRSFQEHIESDPTRYKDFNFYVRSIFLQGLLLLKPCEIPNRLKEASELIASLRDKLSGIGMTPLEATFMLVKSQNWVKGVIVGVRNLGELKRNYESFNMQGHIDLDFLRDLPNIPPRIADPRKW